jgi:ribosome-associated protein
LSRYNSGVAAELVVSGVVIPGSDLSFEAVRSSGPGGQNVNKVSSKIRLRFDLAGSAALPDAAKARLRALARRRITADGALVIVSQRSRDRSQNLADARSKLAELIAQALAIPAVRKGTKPSRAAKRRRVQAKRAQAQKKHRRRGGRDEHDD